LTDRRARDFKVKKVRQESQYNHQLVGGEISSSQLFFYQLKMLAQAYLKLGYNHEVDGRYLK